LHKVGDQTRLYYDARSASHQDSGIETADHCEISSFRCDVVQAFTRLMS